MNKSMRKFLESEDGSLAWPTEKIIKSPLPYRNNAKTRRLLAQLQMKIKAADEQRSMERALKYSEYLAAKREKQRVAAGEEMPAEKKDEAQGPV